MLVSTERGILLYSNSNVMISGPKEFVHNHAQRRGGAVEVVDAPRDSDGDISSVTITGPTFFENNTCEENGDALALEGGCTHNPACHSHMTIDFGSLQSRDGARRVSPDGRGFKSVLDDRRYRSGELCAYCRWSYPRLGN